MYQAFLQLCASPVTWGQVFIGMGLMLSVSAILLLTAFYVSLKAKRAARDLSRSLNGK